MGDGQRYIPELDGLRAIAAVAVVAYHADDGATLRGGYLGVDVFFVLSGFLITRLMKSEIDRTGALNSGAFLLKRALRLYPALLLFLLAYLIAAPMLWPARNHFIDAGFVALYVSNFSVWLWNAPEFLRHTWSLSIEEQFYLLWPLLLPIVLRSQRPVIWLGVAWLAMTCWRMQLADYPSTYFRLDTHATGLILGAAAALVPVRSIRPIYTIVPLLALIATVPLLFSAHIIAFVEVLSALTILAFDQQRSGPVSRILTIQPMQMLGKLSYGIYLWHFPLAYLPGIKLNFLAEFAFILAASTALSAISYYSVEALARSMRARWLPARSADPARPAQDEAWQT
jgi:peptidoglycan/LPS O-acetylase OafA/YrhL